jgi:hypothetical protein
MATLKKKLEALTKQARDSHQAEFITIMDFLNDQASTDPDKGLLRAICDEFIDHATYIKKELTLCQG